MVTFATPGTASSRGRIRQRASVDMSISGTVVDDSPTIITRAVDDSGWIMTGGVPTLTTLGPWATRSVTSCRAR